MKKHMVLVVVTLIFLFSGSAFASGIAPHVAIGPDGSRAIKLEVGATVGDGSWMWMPFAIPIDTSVHSIVTVSFDIYRDFAVDGHQQLAWGWVDENDHWSGVDMSPSWGAEEVFGQLETGEYQTYPFDWFNYADYHANTVFNDYAHITLEWNFGTGYATAMYDGSYILINTPIVDPSDVLYGWDISLNNAYDTGIGAGADTVWIDNFNVTGSDIYNSNGFDGFDLGPLDGQDGWKASAGNPVPIPGAIWLLGSGLLGLVAVRRRKKSSD